MQQIPTSLTQNVNTREMFLVGMNCVTSQASSQSNVSSWYNTEISYRYMYIYSNLESVFSDECSEGK